MRAWRGEQGWSRLIPGTPSSPLAPRQLGPTTSVSISSAFLHFRLLYTATHLTTGRDRGKNGQRKEKKSSQRKALFKTLDQDYLKALKSRCFLKFPPFPAQDGTVPRKWKALTFGRESAVAQSHQAPEQCQGMHPASPRRPECPRARALPLKTHKRMVTY